MLHIVTSMIGTRFTGYIVGIPKATYQVVATSLLKDSEFLCLFVNPETDKPSFKRSFVLSAKEIKHLQNHPDALRLKKVKHFKRQRS